MSILRFAAITAIALTAPGDPARASARITVQATAAREALHVFDPGDPPRNLPILPPRSDAATVCSFTCHPDLEVAIRHIDNLPNRRCRVTAEVTGARLTVELDVTTWLRNDVPDRVAEHEEGHRRICIAAWSDAAGSAAAAAREIAGCDFEAEAGNCADALEAAIDGTAMTLLRRRFDDLTSEVARRVGQRYDRLTSDGRSRFPPAGVAWAGAIASESAAAADTAVPRAGFPPLSLVRFGRRSANEASLAETIRILNSGRW